MDSGSGCWEMGLCQTVVLVQSHGAVMPKFCFFPFQASVGVGSIELGERIQGGDVLVFGDEGGDGRCFASEDQVQVLLGNVRSHGRTSFACCSEVVV